MSFTCGYWIIFAIRTISPNQPNNSYGIPDEFLMTMTVQYMLLNTKCMCLSPLDDDYS